MYEFFQYILYRIPRAIIRSAIVILNNIYCIPTYVIWMILLLPIKKYNANIYYKIEGILFHWLLSLVALWSWTAGYHIIEMGDDITPCRKKETRTLVIANHQSTGDVPLMMTCFNAKPDVLPNLMWIMDHLFKYTNFGIVSLLHLDFFITPGKNSRDLSLQQLKDHLFKAFIPRLRNWLVLFPEGGFLRKRREISKRYAEKMNLPLLINVTLPRIGALKAILEVLVPKSVVSNYISRNSIKTNNNNNSIINNNNDKNSSIKSMGNGSIISNDIIKQDDVNSLQKSHVLDYILDITIAYPNGEPLDLPNIVHGLRLPCNTYFIYRLYNTSEIPQDTESLTKWLFDRWVEKDKMLEDFYQTGDAHTIQRVVHAKTKKYNLIKHVVQQ